MGIYDYNSGKYYFVDHNTKTTHWDYPHPARYTVSADVAPKRPKMQQGQMGISLSDIFAEKGQAQSPPNTRPSITNRQSRGEGEVQRHPQPHGPASQVVVLASDCPVLYA